jgi:hypothetical protein
MRFWILFTGRNRLLCGEILYAVRAVSDHNIGSCSGVQVVGILSSKVSACTTGNDSSA